MSDTLRRWRFVVEDHSGDTAYVGPDGRECDESELWLGTDAEAPREAERRADAWERATSADAARVTYESRGKVDATVSEMLATPTAGLPTRVWP